MESCPIEKFFGQDHRTGNTIFHEIAHDGLLTVLQRIEKNITQPYNDILQKRNNDGDSCIYVAATEHRDQHAINIIKSDGWDGLTAYKMAFIENNQRMMNILQTHGASCEMSKEAVASELSDENVET